MCTVTVLPHPRGVRLVSNRDELRSRAMAEPPAWRRAGPLAALWPRDPESGGTWVGVNAAGIAMTILNRNPRDRRGASGALRSRGTIIPRLLRCDRLDAVLDEASRLAAFEFEPFTLVVVERGALAVVENHRGGSLSLTSRRLLRPVLFTSSSLGDHLVARPRRDLFRRLVERAPSPLRGQAAFHRHRWPRRPEISVWMTRADASTVSRTVVDLTPRGARLRYVPLGDRP
jgi:uncharacterized protein with NRDE domain